MGSKLFVGGLSWGTTDDSLRAAFESFGSVREARVILDRDTGRSRGFGFVTFEQNEHAAAAIQQMNGASLDGRTIRVNEAEERRSSGPRRDYGSRPTVHTRGRRTGPGGGGGGGNDRGGPGGRPPYRGPSDRGGPPDRRGGPPRTGGPPRGRPGGPPRRGPPGGAVPAFQDQNSTGWTEDRSDRRTDFNKRKKKKGPNREDELRARQPAPRRDRRQSGRSWRDYNVDEDGADGVDDDDDFDFG